MKILHFISLLFLISGPLQSDETVYDLYTEAAAQKVQKMTLSEKIGQMILPTIDSLTTNYAPGGISKASYAWHRFGVSTQLGKALGFEAIRRYHLGGLLQNGSPLIYVDSSPEDQTLPNWQKLTETIKLYQDEDLPLLIGTDGIHGNQHVVGSILFPHNIGLGATHDPELIQKIAAWTAYDILKSGFNWSFAPMVAIGHDLRWGRFYECYSSNKDVVRALAENYILGLQGISQQRMYGLIATAKHFIADGDTQMGMDEGTSYTKSDGQLWERNGAGYEGAVQAQVGSVMVSYSSLNDIPMHFGGDFDILRRFRDQGIQYAGEIYKLSGFVVSDYDGVAKAAYKYHLTLVDALAKSINAGVDMLMVSQCAHTDPFDFDHQPPYAIRSSVYYSKIETLIEAVRAAIQSGLIAMERIDDAVLRIVRTKLAMASLATPNLPAGIEEEVALKAAEESLVLLKNKESIIPLNLGQLQFIFLMGFYNDIGMQNGGWTIEWQGNQGNDYWSDEQKSNAHATSLIDGVNHLTSGCDVMIIEGEEAVMQFTLSDVALDNSVAIIVLAEPPYAEYMGDVANDNPWYMRGVKMRENPRMPLNQAHFLGIMFSAQQKEAISHLKEAGVPLITVLLSGRPIVITEGDLPPLASSDAFIAAFLPGTSGGQAIANAIFGVYRLKSAAHEICGKTYFSNTLPFAWPASMEEVLHQSASLYPEGYGLSD